MNMPLHGYIKYIRQLNARYNQFAVPIDNKQHRRHQQTHSTRCPVKTPLTRLEIASAKQRSLALWRKGLIIDVVLWGCYMY
jgi:hypothetical protein